LKFSVVVPTYNRAPLLEKCLAALVRQGYADYEIIVIDDGSSDSTERVVDRFDKVRYLRQENKGPAAARNAGVAASQGQIIAFTDDDCIVPDDWIERLADGYKRFPDAAGVGGYMEAPEETIRNNVFARYEQYVSQARYGVGPDEYFGGFECPAGGTNNMSYAREIFEETGGFDEGFPVAAGEDADFKWRVCQKGNKLLYIPVKATHLQSYDLINFVRQSRRHGVGAVYFERKHHRGMRPFRIILRLKKRLLVFPKDMIMLRPRRLALVKLLNGISSCVGEWGALQYSK
jgi:glycosyltransferase involved in cell wall biosynthesis